jgi:DNA modification methylase
VKLGEYELNQIYTGDARELTKGIPNESVDLIFTDPPYPKQYLSLYGWLAETAARILKPGCFCISLAGNLYFDKVIKQFDIWLSYYWIGGMPHTLGSTNQIHPRQMLSGWKPVIWYVKDTPKKHPYVFDFFMTKPDKNHHEWGQPASWACYYLEKLSKPGDVIFEPFTGGASVLVACKVLKRDYLAFEIDQNTAEKARQRVLNTPEMLPFIYSDSYQGKLFEGMENAAEQQDEADAGKAAEI